MPVDPAASRRRARLDDSDERSFGKDTTESVIIGNQLATCL
jgi:hypothetical protein